MTNNSNGNSNNSNGSRIVSVLLFVAALVYLGYRFVLPKVDTSWAVEEAELEVKSDVYNTYGEIPKLNSSLIYSNDNDYLVIVRFTLSDFGWKGSFACHVFGFRSGNAHVSDMTREMPYDYTYNVEELKAMWGLK